MATSSINNIAIVGISAAVPKKTSINSNLKFISTTGISEKRISESEICTSDLCFSAADALLNDLNIDRNEIDILVFVSQTSDYKLPVTSTILQNKLKLSQTCICFDIPLGCSGYTYGLSIISSLISLHKLKKGLLLVGDTISKEIDSNDSSTEPLFGDAGAATLLEYDDNADTIYFDLGSDGSGYESIIIPKGNSRNKNNSDSKDTLVLNGIDVFNFGISKVPKTINTFLNTINLEISNIDLFVFHQANKLMNDKIYSKLKIPVTKTISSLKKFGNTSSATIPLTIVTQLNSINKNQKLLFCGFGVGLSWGTILLSPNKDIYCSKLIEI